jgi:hypothetical protein
VDALIAANKDSFHDFFLQLRVSVAEGLPIEKLFAFSFAPLQNQDVDSTIYDPKAEYERLGLNRDGWRITDCNLNYLLCETYPSLLSVPQAISDSDLIALSNYRTKARIPVAVWRSIENRSVILRCSQPKVGMTDTRNKRDERLFKLLAKQVTQVYIFDARPKLSALANKLRGGGVESGKVYPKRIFLNIDNIHVMRHALEKLRQSCIAYVREEVKYVDASSWFHHISLLLSGALHIANTIHNSLGSVAVVLHCSDGWDRTPQLLCLAELLLDPQYRTIHGFEILIEKDWLSFGHKFAERTGNFLFLNSFFYLKMRFFYSIQLNFLFLFSPFFLLYKSNRSY